MEKVERSPYKLTFVPSAIGFRVWGYDYWRNELTGVIHGEDWQPKEWMEGRCKCYETICRCGISAFSKKEAAVSFGASLAGGGPHILGVVQGLEPFLKEKGEWRSWHVKILAFIMIEFSQGKWLSEEYLREISKKYKTAVWQYQETEEQLNQRFGSN